MAREIASQIALRRRQIDTRKLMTSGAALLAVVLLAMAWTPMTSVASVPTQPIAAEKEPFSTPVAAVFLLESDAQATLTPPLLGNYAPGADATDEPDATSGA
ncbi:MAG: hypothetical protein IPK19_35265 [Chloroflexi bacterium]|nr:hypothetical protein [Chloroflexota bacterium]